MFHNTLRQSFRYRRLSDARLSNENRVVFLAAAQNLRNALQLLLTSHDRVEATFLSGTRQIPAKTVESGRVRLRIALALRRLRRFHTAFIVILIKLKHILRSLNYIVILVLHRIFWR